MALDLLAKLNIEQRRAVEHGVGDPAAGLAAPLLVIAGAGSGKTNTLAHRVANLIVNGVDPRRILLMTFSRRAASEMSRRVESICSKVLGPKAGGDRPGSCRCRRAYARHVAVRESSLCVLYAGTRRRSARRPSSTISGSLYRWQRNDGMALAFTAAFRQNPPSFVPVGFWVRDDIAPQLAPLRVPGG
jgi:ATP-dependent exoDNAse (exonuclease V) beta subunit